MRRRGWFLFQVVGMFVLIIAAPRALAGIVDGLGGPYEVHAAPPASASELPRLGDGSSSPRREATANRTVSTP